MTATNSTEQLKHPTKISHTFRESLLAYFFILPAVLVTAIFFVYPVVSGLWESFKAGSPLPTEYVGLDQYVRSIGSLIYIILLALCLIFLSIASGNWQKLRNKEQKISNDSATLYLLPSFFAALSSFAVIGLLVTKGYKYPLFSGFSIIWIPAFIFVLSIVGYYIVSNITNTRKERTSYALRTWLVMLLTILPILMVRYAYGQLKGNVEEARSIAALVLNTETGNARPLREVTGGTFTDVEIGEVPVQVNINNEVYEAFLAQDFYQEIEVDNVTSESILSLANNQRIQVNIPLERGLGLGSVNYTAEGTLVVEREAGQIGGGAPTLEVPITISGDNVAAPYDIYFTGDVGPNVVARGGHTVPIDRPFQAAIAIVVCLGAIYVVSKARQELSVDEDPNKQQLGDWLGIGRLILWVIVIGLSAYVATQVIFYRDAAIGIQRLSQEQLEVAYEYGTGQPAPASLLRDRIAQRLFFFPQIISISAGALLIAVAYMFWTGAKDRDTGVGMSGNLLISVLFMIGGWLCISELPSTIMLAGTDAIEARDAMVRTAMYSLGTVPAQLAIGMLLAYLMFYEVTIGKGLFRLIYFMPYITPQIATATVFTVIFNSRINSLANQFLEVFGIGEQKWLQEGQGVIRVAYMELFSGDPSHIPDILQGPSLALLTVILFNIWVYSGYNAVIFLAGLGSIPGELYEAARVDGAGRWAAFRHITFPLLSPVTFFLSILAIIGTFKAFGSVYVLRVQETDYADTFTIRIFDALVRENNRGYAAALAFVLFGVIMILTLVQNRLSRDRVFYG